MEANGGRKMKVGSQIMIVVVVVVVEGRNYIKMKQGK